MKLWIFALQVVVICMILQVPGCLPSCLIVGTIASCASQNLHSVPVLPPNITHLYLEMNHIREVNASSLSGLEELRELDLGFQYTRLVIRNNTFSKQRHLRKLVLDFNVKLQLELQAFVGLSILESLHLDYCSLQESILNDNYLEPLSSLKTLSLFGNNIKTLKPSLFFSNMTNLNKLNLKLNKIDKICESDLRSFHGKHFQILNFNSIQITAMSDENFDWQKCGNPFRGMSFEILDMSYNGFSTTKSKLFFRAIKGTKIFHLKLSGPMGKGFSFDNLPDPDQSTFEGLKNSSVRTLDLSKNRIFALQRGVFSPLVEVVIIDISQNRVNQIHKNAFEGLEGHLKMLNLSQNLIGEIYYYSFSSLTNLQVLDLSYNHIGVLGFGSFSGLPHLKALHLTGNSLRALSLPASLPSLSYLLINDNKLTSSTVSNIKLFAPNIKHLNVQLNRLTNLGDIYTLVSQLKHLQHLFYGGNSIQWCEVSGQISEIGLNKLETLDLHHSNLQSIWSQGRCLNLFDNLRHLMSLNLSLNGLQSLPWGVFKGLTSLVEMDLSSNTLTYLQSDVFPKSLNILNLANNFIASPNPDIFHSLQFLNLRMNRFHCNPNLNSFLTWLIDTNVTFLNPVEELRCEFPAGFYNIPVLAYSWLVT
ncbi:toll-like receptor 5 [Aulostomus maculatus]